MDETFFSMSSIALAALVAVNLPRLKRRIELSRAKHRSLAGHSKMAKRIAGMIPGYAYGEELFFGCDDAPDEVRQRRQIGFARLSQLYGERFAKSAEMTAQARESISDLQFTGSYRVPFQFSPYQAVEIPIDSARRLSEHRVTE